MIGLTHVASGVIVRMPEMPVGPPSAVNDAPERSLDLPTRAFFGILLAAAALAAIFLGGFYLATFLAAVAVAAAREWHRLVGGARYALETAFTGGAIAAALVAFAATPKPLPALAILAAGAIAAGGVSFLRGAPATWSAAGTLYIGVPALCLIALRDVTPYGAWVVAGLFLTVWTADTGALLSGRLVGGPRLAPVLSPNKTWSGFVGGIILPAASLFLYVTWLGGNAWKAGALGMVLAAGGHGGDLFESWIKRRVGRKNSGSLIPGHGGVLDRIDSTLFVAPLAAGLVFVFGLDLLFGAHP